MARFCSLLVLWCALATTFHCVLAANAVAVAWLLSILLRRIWFEKRRKRKGKKEYEIESDVAVIYSHDRIPFHFFVYHADRGTSLGTNAPDTLYLVAPKFLVYRLSLA
jgi:hypothetical protein